MTTVAVQECLARIHCLFPEANEIEVMCNQYEPIIDLLFTLYCAQNDAIGRFAQEKGIADRPLSEMEARWITDPDGEKHFYSGFKESNPREFDEIKKHCDFFVLMFFQMLLQCDPTHLYLLEKRLDHPVNAHELSFYSSIPGDPEEVALGHLRTRFEPVLKETIQ